MGFINKSINQMCQNYICEDLCRVILNSIEYMQNICDDVPYLENPITDVLCSKTLMNEEYRDLNDIKIYRFERENQENYYPNKTGKTDIKVLIDNVSFQNLDAYFIIECKRIDGTKELNKKYVNEGIKRFVSNNESYYSTKYKNQAFMIMYVRDKNINLNYCIKQINDLQERCIDICVTRDMEMYGLCDIISKYKKLDQEIKIQHFVFYVDKLTNQK